MQLYWFKHISADRFITRPNLCSAFTYLLFLDNYGLLSPHNYRSDVWPWIYFLFTGQILKSREAERLKPQTAPFEHGSVFVPWHCDRSCLSNKKGKQWHSVACNCIQGSTSQKYSGALRYLTSNKTAVALSFAEICRSRLLYLPHTHRHTHSFENRRMSGTDVVLILTYTYLLHRQPCEKTNSVSQFKMLVKAGKHNTTCDRFLSQIAVH